MEETVTLTTPMIASAIVLLVSFIGIFTEELHGFHRSKFALGGAVAMIIVGQIFGFYSPQTALKALDWNVIFLLACMMTFVAILAPTGGFQAVAYKIAEISRGRQFFLLTLLSLAGAVISMFLDNVTTVVIFGPLVFLICRTLKVSPIPYLVAICLLSVTGGISTIIGDPTSIMIGSTSGQTFVGYITKMLPIFVVSSIAMLAAVRFIFRKQFPEKITVPVIEKKGNIKDKQTWFVGLASILLMMVLFIFHSSWGWEPWFVGAIGLTIITFFGKKVDMLHVFENVEIILLMFLVSLFVIIGGVENSGFLDFVAQTISPFMQNDILVATVTLLWISAILSAVVDNIPFVAAMIPIISGLQARGVDVEPLWWGLAAGAGMGGLLTHVGSAVNVFIVSLSERIAHQSGDHSVALTPTKWFKKATPAALVGLIFATILIVLMFNFYETPII